MLGFKKYGKRNRARSNADRELIMDLVRERYADFAPTLATEKLWENHRLKVSNETLRAWMKDEGLCKDRGNAPMCPTPLHKSCSDVRHMNEWQLSGTQYRASNDPHWRHFQRNRPFCRPSACRLRSGCFRG